MQIDECVLDFQLQRADRIEDLGLSDRTLVLRDIGSQIPLAAALEQHVEAHAVLGWPRTVLLVEAGPEEIQVVAADAQHRVGSELCRDQIRVGNAETRTFGHEIEVLGERFSDGCLQCQAFHGAAGRPHLTVHWRCSSDQSQQKYPERESHLQRDCSARAVAAWREIHAISSSSRVMLARFTDGVLDCGRYSAATCVFGRFACALEPDVGVLH